MDHITGRSENLVDGTEVVVHEHLPADREHDAVGIDGDGLAVIRRGPPKGSSWR
jgi:hypothetical protein